MIVILFPIFFFNNKMPNDAIHLFTSAPLKLQLTRKKDT